jgi:hypothetical protein
MTIPEAHAGLFDFLFGHYAVPQMPAPLPRVVSRFRRKVRREVVVKSVKEVRSRSNMAFGCKDGGDPMNALLNDPTLRDGDAWPTCHHHGRAAN